MNYQMSLFDITSTLDELKPIKSNDYRWSMSTDYPPKNGLKVFSCFACGGGEYNGVQTCRMRSAWLLRN